MCLSHAQSAQDLEVDFEPTQEVFASQTGHGPTDHDDALRARPLIELEWASQRASGRRRHAKELDLLQEALLVDIGGSG
jgi:hypothetical protein